MHLNWASVVCTVLNGSKVDGQLVCQPSIPGKQLTLAGKRIVICTDNLPITDVWQAGSSKSKPIMSLVCQTFLTAANNQFSLSLKYIPGKRNTAADQISGFQVDEFKEVVPEADTDPTVLPPHVVQLMHQ